jgi:translation initiation factor 3 subunit H
MLIISLLFLLHIKKEEDVADADGANYQLEMMRCLSEVNVDNNTMK